MVRVMNQCFRKTLTILALGVPCSWLRVGLEINSCHPASFCTAWALEVERRSCRDNGRRQLYFLTFGMPVLLNFAQNSRQMVLPLESFTPHEPSLRYWTCRTESHTHFWLGPALPWEQSLGLDSGTRVPLCLVR